MAKKGTYIVTADFKTPYVVGSHDARNPTEIRWKHFKKGELIAGELKHENNKPAYVMYNGVCVIPLSVVKAVVTKEILSGAEGPANTELPGRETTKSIVEVKNKKVTYMDAMLVGGIIGLGAIFFANKKQWIKVPANINYAYGAGAGALLAAYLIYRNNNKPKKITG